MSQGKKRPLYESHLPYLPTLREAPVNELRDPAWNEEKALDEVLKRVELITEAAHVNASQFYARGLHKKDVSWEAFFIILLALSDHHHAEIREHWLRLERSYSTLMMTCHRGSLVKVLRELGVHTVQRKNNVEVGLPWEDANVTHSGTLEEVTQETLAAMLAEPYLEVHAQALEEVVWPNNAAIVDALRARWFPSRADADAESSASPSDTSDHRTL